jgi:hypothetical protein
VPRIDDQPLEEIDDSGDDELTEHMAPVVDTLSPLARDPILPEPETAAQATAEQLGGSRLPEALATETLTVPGTPMALGSPRATPSVPFAPARSPTGPEPAIAGAAPPPGAPIGPMSGRMPGSPFAAPPWQTGQPSSQQQPPPSLVARVARSWAIIDLPPFDPEQFERQRRIVLRVVIGLIGFVIVLAVFAGRC